MAAGVAEPMLQNLTSTTIRAPYSSAAAPSMADSLPTLNFGFDDLRARMNSFTKRFDEFIEQGRRRVLEERNQFRMDVADVQDQQTQKHRSIATLTQQTQAHAVTLSSQSAEAAELHSAIAALTTSRDTHAATASTLRSKLASVKQAIEAKRATQRQQDAYLARQAGCDAPELEFWEGYLGLRIEGAGSEDRVRFVFCGVAERKAEREAWFELEMAGARGGYEVVGCRPKLEEAEVERCLGRMRDGEDLVGFLKGMRELFVQALR